MRFLLFSIYGMLMELRLAAQRAAGAPLLTEFKDDETALPTKYTHIMLVDKIFLSLNMVARNVLFVTYTCPVTVIYSWKLFKLNLFSITGGSFLVSGSTDHIIRIYQMTPGPPERIAELDVHNVSIGCTYLKQVYYEKAASKGLLCLVQMFIQISTVYTFVKWKTGIIN